MNRPDDFVRRGREEAARLQQLALAFPMLPQPCEAERAAVAQAEVERVALGARPHPLEEAVCRDEGQRRRRKALRKVGSVSAVSDRALIGPAPLSPACEHDGTS